MKSYCQPRIIIAGVIIISSIFSCNSSENTAVGNWVEVSTLNQKVQSIYFFNESVGWVVGDSGYVSMTNDGGETWNDQSITSDSRLSSLFFINEQTGLMTGNNVIYLTTDQGESWEPNVIVQDSTVYFTSIHTGGDNKLYALSRSGEIYQSNLLGENWENIHNFEGYGFDYLNFSEAPIGFASQVHSDKFYKTLDGGATWQEVEYPTRWSSGVFFLDDKVGWVAEDFMASSAIHESMSVFMTVNGGQDWITQSTLDMLFLYDITFANKREGWASQISEILYTPNAGKTWTSQFQVGETDFEYIRDIFILDRENGWALTSLGRVIRYSMDRTSS